MTLARLAPISLDCSDPPALAMFWARLLGGEISLIADDYVVVGTDRGALCARAVPDYQPPESVEVNVHLEIAVADLDAAVREAVRLGATPLEGQPMLDSMRVLLDPAGHSFCLTTSIPMNWAS